MWKKIDKELFIKKFKKIFWFGFIIFIIYVAWMMGTVRGTFYGVSVILKRNNESMCNLLNKTEDNEGYCILKEGAKYNQRLKCSFGKFVVKGNASMSKRIFVGEYIRLLMVYTAFGFCTLK